MPASLQGVWVTIYEGPGVEADDSQVIRWLEQYLTTQDISVVVVTHDRAFMEAVCTSVLELESGEVTLHNFGGPGSYDRFRQVCFTRVPA